MYQDKDRADDSLILEESVMAIILPHVTILSRVRFNQLDSNQL